MFFELLYYRLGKGKSKGYDDYGSGGGDYDSYGGGGFGGASPSGDYGGGGYVSQGSGGYGDDNRYAPY